MFASSPQVAMLHRSTTSTSRTKAAAAHFEKSLQSRKCLYHDRRSVLAIASSGFIPKSDTTIVQRNSGRVVYLCRCALLTCIGRTIQSAKWRCTGLTVASPPDPSSLQPRLFLPVAILMYFNPLRKRGRALAAMSR